jgi:hypothetical protein
MRRKGAGPEARLSGTGRIEKGSGRRIARILAIVDIADASPRELRERFVEAERSAIQRAYAGGRIDFAQAEEFIRALPARGRA